VSSITSVDGLVSGLNTSDIITKLMQVEAQPQTILKSKLAAQQTVITAYQSVNSKMAALKTAADALTATTLTNLTKTSAWQGVAATSSSASVTATATPGAPVGQFTFDVTSLAKNHIMTVALTSDDTDAVSGPQLQVSINGAHPPIPIVVDDNNPQGTADAINAANLGIRATVISTNQGRILQLSATQTGAAHSFTIDGFVTPPKLLRQGTDATITVGDPNNGGYAVSSPTNTITGVPPGVTLTVTKEQDLGVTISVNPDASGLSDKMQTMVDALNAALTEIKAKTAFDPIGKTGGALTGNLGVQQIQDKLLSTVSNGLAGYGAFNKLGVQLDSSGALTFDKTVFQAAYQADPAATQNAVSTGLAATLGALAKKATDPIVGTLTQAVHGSNDRVRTLNTEIASWDVRLAARRTALQRQYSGLEVALGRMKDQSSWLAGQIANLPTGSA
jgi:flagellar hook-associated protein 2